MAATHPPWARITRPIDHSTRYQRRRAPNQKRQKKSTNERFNTVFRNEYPLGPILSSDVGTSELIQQSTHDLVKRMGIRVYFAGEWHLAPRDLQDIFHQAVDGEKIEPRSEKALTANILAQMIGNISKVHSFANFENIWCFYMEHANTYRKTLTCLPIPVTLPPTPPGASIDNIAKYLMSPKMAHISISQVAAECPGFELCPGGFKEQIKYYVPNSELRAEFLADPRKYLEKYPEFQKDADLEPSDLEKSSLFCAGCEKRISNTAYLQHIEAQIQNAMICDDKGIPLKTPTIHKSMKDGVCLQCPCCHKYTRLNKQIYTWFCQSLTELSKAEQTAQKAKFNEMKETIFQGTFALQFPAFWVHCPAQGCKFSSGYSILQPHLLAQPEVFPLCAICMFHHRNPCRVGNTARCVTCTRNHSIDLHVGICPDPKCRTHVCAICKLSAKAGEKCHRGQPCKGNGFATLDAETQEEFLKMGIKTCPGCKGGVMQRDGCDHMSCPCGTEFCFRCQGIFTGYYSSHNCPGEDGDIERPKDPRLRGDFDHDVAARQRVEDRAREIRERDRRERDRREQERQEQIRFERIEREQFRREQERQDRDLRERVYREAEQRVRIFHERRIREGPADLPAPAPQAPAPQAPAPVEAQNAQLLQLEQAQQQLMLQHGLVANNDGDIPIELLFAMFGENEQH